MRKNFYDQNGNLKDDEYYNSKHRKNIDFRNLLVIAGKVSGVIFIGSIVAYYLSGLIEFLKW